MPNLDDISNRVKQDFNTLDKNKDNSLSPEEFSKLKMPHLTEEARNSAYKQMANINGDPNALTKVEVQETIDKLQSRPKEERFREIADRLEVVFGKEVTIPNVRDFNGVPSFVISGGKNKAEAEAIIDKLVEARAQMGLEKKDISFRSDQSGNITIYGGDVLNYAETGADAKQKVFETIESPENMKKFKACFPEEKKNSALSLENASKEVCEIFGAKPNYSSSKQENLILIESKSSNIVGQVDKLVELRNRLGIKKEDLLFIDDISGNIGINAKFFLSGDQEQIKDVLDIMKAHREEFRNCLK